MSHHRSCPIIFQLFEKNKSKYICFTSNNDIHFQFSKAVESLNIEMLWTMMYIYGSVDYPEIVVRDMRVKSNESLGKL